MERVVCTFIPNELEGGGGETFLVPDPGDIHTSEILASEFVKRRWGKVEIPLGTPSAAVSNLDGNGLATTGSGNTPSTDRVQVAVSRRTGELVIEDM